MASIQGTAGGIVALLLVVIMVGVVAAPLITDIANGSPFEGDNDNGTGLNWTYKTASEITSSITMSAVEDDLVIGDKSYNNSGMGGPHVGVLSDAFYLRVSHAKQVFVNFSDDTVKASTTYDIVLTVSTGGAYSVSINNEVVKTGTFTWILYPDEEGTWGRFAFGGIVSPNQKAVISYAITNRTGVQPYNFLATITNNELTMVKAPYNEGSTAITAASGVTVSIDATTLGSGQMVYKFERWDQTWTADNATVHSDSPSESVIYAPIHYKSAITADSDQMSSIQLALIGIVPTMLAVVAVVVGARMITRE